MVFMAWSAASTDWLAGAQLLPRTWAAKEQWIGVGILPDCEVPGGARRCAAHPSSVIMSVSLSMSIGGVGVGCWAGPADEDQFSEQPSDNPIVLGGAI